MSSWLKLKSGPDRLWPSYKTAALKIINHLWCLKLGVTYKGNTNFLLALRRWLRIVTIIFTTNLTLIWILLQDNNKREWLEYKNVCYGLFLRKMWCDNDNINGRLRSRYTGQLLMESFLNQLAATVRSQNPHVLGGRKSFIVYGVSHLE